MRRRGITLIELLLAVSIAALVMMAASNAYIVGSRTAKTLGDGRDAVARQAAFEDALTDLFNHVYVDVDTTNLNTYFISGDALSGKSAQSGGSGSAGGSTNEGGLAFTVVGRRLPNGLLASTEDFETNNRKYGPVAGVTEIQLGTSPVGSPTEEIRGLYLREQAPSDTDPTQGGRESQLANDVESISFEFYDGSQWTTTWDTTTMTTRRLPSAVRVTYRLIGETEDRILTFAVPASDVTPDNPVAQETVS